MKDEYIIINKTAIQKRIEELEKEIDDKKIDVEVQRLIKHELKQILSNSAPIIPEIEKALIESWQTKGEWDLNYKIIIPSEEPTMITDWLNEYGDPEIYKKVERELELREAAAIGKFAEKKYLERLNNFQSIDFKDGVFEGAKWMRDKILNK